MKFFSLFAILVATACASVPHKDFSKITVGMYKGDVLDQLGSPSESRFRGDKYVWSYKFMDNDHWVTKEVHVKNDFVTYAGDPQPMASDSKISRIAAGMTKSQVLDVMGFPKKTQKNNGKDSWVYTSKQHGDAQVQFDEDKVVFIGPVENAEEPASDASGPKPAADKNFEPVQ